MLDHGEGRRKDTTTISRPRHAQLINRRIVASSMTCSHLELVRGSVSFLQAVSRAIKTSGEWKIWHVCGRGCCLLQIAASFAPGSRLVSTLHIFHYIGRDRLFMFRTVSSATGRL